MASRRHLRIFIVAAFVGLGLIPATASAERHSNGPRLRPARAAAKVEPRPRRPHKKSSTLAKVRTHRKEVVAPNRFNVHRGIHEYSEGLGPHFAPYVEKLSSSAHWIDAGAGRALAHRDYARFGRARMTSVSLTRPADPELEAFERSAKDRGFRYLHGNPIENLSPRKLGAADLITDVYGPAVYAANLGKVMGVYVNTLKRGGRIYLLLDGHTSFQKSGKPSSFEAWLESGSGLRVVARGTHEDSIATRYRLARNRPPVKESYVKRTEFPGATWYVIEKTAPRVELPALDLRTFEPTPIPERVFAWR
jgi:hypothetical protein